MSTRVVRNMRDFIRHGMGIEVVCGCGHSAVLDAYKVVARFEARRWYMGLNDGYAFGSPYSHFRCSRCGNRPERIGPGER